MMSEIQFNGIKVIPMTEFWVDCFSTAIFSILLTHCKIEKKHIYNNNYEYTFNVNERKKLGRVFVTMKIDELVKGVLIDKEEHKFSLDDDIISNIKKYIDLGKIILLGIDMYYGVSDTSQWHKHHIRHYIVVEGYDDVNRCVYILETGESGYKEYIMSYEELEIAARNFEDVSYAYTVNSSFTDVMYDIEEIKSNARDIIKSIKEIKTHVEEIWHVDEKNLLSMRDEIDTHLKSIANRQKVNRLLFDSIFQDDTKVEYTKGFERLEKKFFQLRDIFIETCSSKKYFMHELQIKQELITLLDEEKDIWEKFCLS